MKQASLHNINARRKRLSLLLARGLNNRVSKETETHRVSPRIVIYQSEFEYLAKCILDRNDIETGGQLFGHWTSGGTPVILYAIGPGPNANHQPTFFNQDVEYLVKVGHLLKRRFGLHHIGEWHSHHQLGLDHPSRYDVQTMTSTIRGKGLKRFLLCIGTCSSDAASVRGFYCDESRCTDANWDVIPVASPIRKEADLSFEDVLVHPGYPDGNRTIKQSSYGQ